MSGIQRKNHRYILSAWIQGTAARVACLGWSVGGVDSFGCPGPKAFSTSSRKKHVVKQIRFKVANWTRYFNKPFFSTWSLSPWWDQVPTFDTHPNQRALPFKVKKTLSIYMFHGVWFWWVHELYGSWPPIISSSEAAAKRANSNQGSTESTTLAFALGDLWTTTGMW